MQKLIQQLKDSWFILAFVAGIFVWYANTNSRLAAVEAKQVEQQSALQEISQLKTDIAVIKANVEFIKERID